MLIVMLCVIITDIKSKKGLKSETIPTIVLNHWICHILANIIEAENSFCYDGMSLKRVRMGWS